MESISQDLQRAEQYKTENDFKFRSQERQNLPVFSYRQQILDQIKQHNVILIRGATGCGKTTQVILNKFHSISTKKFFRFLNIYLTMQLNMVKVLFVILLWHNLDVLVQFQSLNVWLGVRISLICLFYFNVFFFSSIE